MVKHLHTLVTLSAVLSSDRSNCFACVTNVVHWVVDVTVVAPRSWVANLRERKTKGRAQKD